MQETSLKQRMQRQEHLISIEKACVLRHSSILTQSIRKASLSLFLDLIKFMIQQQSISSYDLGFKIKLYIHEADIMEVCLGRST